MPEFQTINLDVADDIATITLNRPDHMNACTVRMMHELIDAFDETDANDGVRAVIVTGAGKAFCAGADLAAGGDTFNYAAQGAHSDPRDVRSPDRDGGGEVALRIYASLKPVIAAINGAAVGVGATILLPMDMRLASVEARFGFVFTRRGIVPETCSSFYLPRLVGLQTANEWMMTGRVFSAQEAKELGLVRSLHTPLDLLAAANALAREIADNTSPVSVALTRHMLLDMLGANHPMEAHRLESSLVLMCGRSEDAREGVTAFLQKRPAEFPLKVSRDLPQPFPWKQAPTF